MNMSLLKSTELVTGVVEPSGPSGENTGAAGWALCFSLETWHRDDQAIVSTPLRLRCGVEQSEFASWFARVRPCEIVSARVRFEDAHSAQLVEILEPQGASEALARRSADLLAPKTFVAEGFGEFTLDRRLDWYEGDAAWCGRTVRLTLKASDDAGLDSAIRAAAKLWDAQGAWSARLEDCAIAHLLDLKNESWLDDDGEPIEASQFRRCLTLESVMVEPNGNFEFWYDDGELFYGHAIRVAGNLLEGATDASIQG